MNSEKQKVSPSKKKKKHEYGNGLKLINNYKEVGSLFGNDVANTVI